MLKNEASSSRLAEVSSSMLTISESRIETSPWTSAIVISPSTFEKSGTESSVVIKNSWMWNDVGEMCGIVETPAFPDLGGSISVSIVGCSVFAPATAVASVSEDVGMCCIVDKFAFIRIDDSRCEQWRIRFVLEFFLLLPPLLPHSQSRTLRHSPDGTNPEFVDDGTEYRFVYTSAPSDLKDTFATFTHCIFPGDHYTVTTRPITLSFYPGTVTISSCSFLNHRFDYESEAQSHETDYGELSASFTSTRNHTSQSPLNTQTSQTTQHAKCGDNEDGNIDTGGLFLRLDHQSGRSTITNLIFESCNATHQASAMIAYVSADILFSNCLFNKCYPSSDAGGVSEIKELTFTDCWSDTRGGHEMTFFSQRDLNLTDCRFLRCTSIEDDESAGGFFGSVYDSTLTVQSCSFVNCSALDGPGGAFHVLSDGSSVVSDCLVEGCYSEVAGAVCFRARDDTPISVSLTRVAFVNNSDGHNFTYYFYDYPPLDQTGFADVYLDIQYCDTTPSISIIDCFTTCATDNIGMHMTANRYTPEQSIVRVFDVEFNKIGPRLTEKAVVSLDPESGRMELVVSVSIPIASQKYEISIQKEGDKTKSKTEIEFVNGKGTLESPSPSLNLDFSTTYTITSIVAIVPSSSSSLSNDLTFPQAAWVFNLASNSSFFSFTTPTPPFSLISDASAHIILSNQKYAFITLHFNAPVSGSYDFVVEERGKDVAFTVVVESPGKTAETEEFVVVGDDRILTHDTTYTIKSIVPTPGSESTPVVMRDPITFHIPQSSYMPPQEPEDPKPDPEDPKPDPEDPKPDPEDPKPEPEDPEDPKALSPVQKLLSWLIPLVVSLLVVLLMIIVILVLVNRRKTKAVLSLKEMEEQTEDVLNEKVEVEHVGPDHTNAAIFPEAISHSNFRPDDSLLPTEEGVQQASQNDALGELVEVMKCSGDFAVSTARMDTTLYSVIHTQKKEIGKRAIGLQIVNGLKQVVARRGQSDVLTHLSSHWILLDSAENVSLKLEMSSTEAEQAALLAQKERNAHAVGVEGEKCGMDGLRWRAPEVAAGSGEVDGQNASVLVLA
ncbi:hypothetical protein BLNAU_18818 [Blattamonas nauphoetae]|uniref:Right handed beta helix domain-containing protein n=1 Tax=Blattamonas nauphoetae TaxID=2049346 RepID=A0ABQ9X379_9EUKA|nr:hypothetical protein BLNAU_18818 [Blattamonas nauphoetae]